MLGLPGQANLVRELNEDAANEQIFDRNFDVQDVMLHECPDDDGSDGYPVEDEIFKLTCSKCTKSFWIYWVFVEFRVILFSHNLKIQKWSDNSDTILLRNPARDP